MDFLLNPLTLVTFFPLLGVLVILFINRENKTVIRWVALITSLLTFGISRFANGD
jgi:NADH-quinone oxidoreductase subunit M